MDVDDERALASAIGAIEAQGDAMAVVGDRLVMRDPHRLDRDAGPLGDDLEQQPAVRAPGRDVAHRREPALGAHGQQRLDGVVHLEDPRGAWLRRG